MGQTQEKSFDVESDFTDILEVSNESVEGFYRHVNEHEHADYVKHSVDSDHLGVVWEGTLYTETWVVHHAKGEYIPQEFKDISFI